MSTILSLSRSCLCRRGIGVLAILLLSATAAAAEQTVDRGPLVVAQGPLTVDRGETDHGPRTTVHEQYLRACQPTNLFPVAAILGDRQRMVQVALIFMGVAILILTRGNRF